MLNPHFFVGYKRPQHDKTRNSSNVKTNRLIHDNTITEKQMSQTATNSLY